MKERREREEQKKHALPPTPRKNGKERKSGGYPRATKAEAPTGEPKLGNREVGSRMS